MEKPDPAYKGENSYVFVSYSHADASSVYPEISRLQKLGLNIWYDEGISPGTVWRDELANAIESCRVFLIFLSANANASDHVRKELNFALDNECEVLAVHLEDVELSGALRLSLSDLQAILKHDLSVREYEAALEQALDAALGSIPETPAPRSGKRSITQRWVAPAIVAALVAAFVVWINMNPPTEYTAEDSTNSDLPLLERRTLAVLPFENLSGDEYDYFAAGLTEDLINRFGEYRIFPVIGSYSTAGYRKADLDLREAAKELGADYMLRGSVRRSDERVRVNVHLYEGASGAQIWSERYDRVLDDILGTQDDISLAIIGRMNPQLQIFDMQHAMRRPAADVTAWDLSQQGWWHFSRVTNENNLAAQDAHGRAIARDPKSAFAAAGLALAHYQRIGLGWSTNTEENIRQLVASAERAVVLDANSPHAHHALGHAHALTGDHQAMINAFERSITLNPSSTLVAQCAGEGLAMAGESDRAIEQLQQALRLSPKDATTFVMYHSLALAHFAEERYSEAIEWARRSVAINPKFPFALRTLAASLAHEGQIEEAQDLIARAAAIEPDFSLGGGRRVVLTGSPDFSERYMQGLRMAGL